MAQYKLHKATALPGTPENNSVYFIKEGTNEFKIYVTDTSGTAYSLATGDREIKLVSNTSQYTVVAEDYKSKILVFDADVAGAEIDVIINNGVATVLTDELIIYSAADHVLNFTEGTGITLKTTAGNLLKSANDGDSIAILGVKPLLNLTTFAVYGTLEFTLDGIGFYDNLASFPPTGDLDRLYIAKDTKVLYLWNGSGYESTTTETSGSDKNYLHTQGAVASTWNIAHNLNKYPSVTVFDSADSLVHGDVNYTDLNNLTITFSAPFSGKATLN